LFHPTLVVNAEPSEYFEAKTRLEMLSFWTQTVKTIVKTKESSMWKVPILAKKSPEEEMEKGSLSGVHVCSRPLPLFYMSDYSVLGLKVHPLEEALRIIGERGFFLEEQGCGPEVILDDPSFLVNLMDTLREAGVSYEIADLIGGVYQG
jgi:hypothetical protein